jgi:hypothetical protein
VAVLLSCDFVASRPAVDYLCLLQPFYQISSGAQPSFSTKNDLLHKIDELPLRGPEWECDFVTIKGDVLDPNTGKPVEEEVELWRRNPVDCIKELLGNPIFCSIMRYAPERVYCDKEEKVHVYSEAWTADWWWEMQVRTVISIGLMTRSDNAYFSLGLRARGSPLHLSSWPQIRLSSLNSEVTRALGRFI